LYNIKISEVKRAFIALFLLFPFFGEAQVYFNKLYAPSLEDITHQVKYNLGQGELGLEVYS